MVARKDYGCIKILNILAQPCEACDDSASMTPFKKNAAAVASRVGSSDLTDLEIKP